MRKRPFDRRAKSYRRGDTEKLIEQRSQGGVPDNMQVLVGRNPLREILKVCPERIRRVFILDGYLNSDKQDIVELINSLQVVKGQEERQEKGRKPSFLIEECSRERLDGLSFGNIHQGFVVLLEAKQPLKLVDFIEELSPGDEQEADQYGQDDSIINTDQANKLIIMIDSLEDPQNLGAILRTAECFSALGVIWSKNRGVGLTHTARKVSSGASELIDCVEVPNLVDAAKKIKELGYWLVGAKNSANSKSLIDFHFPIKTLLILGSEKSGIHRLLEEQLDFIVKIPLTGKIESLNVSQAASIFMYAYKACQNKW